MGKRKAISKQTRFEVFKRDKFTCQYCGRKAPDVTLEVDHIIPVSKGGTNDIINLITSCKECNRGKRDKVLSDDSAIQKQQKQLEEMQERKEMVQMMLLWKKELENEIEDEIEAVNMYIKKVSEYELTDTGKRKIRLLIERFSFNEVYEATAISFAKYYAPRPCPINWDKAFGKIGGVCYNRKNNVTVDEWIKKRGK